MSPKATKIVALLGLAWFGFIVTILVWDAID